MATVDEVVVKVRGDLKDINTKLQRLDKNVKTTTERASKAFQNMARIAGIALGAMVVRSATNAGGAIVNLAARTEELNNKFNVVFGNEATRVRAILESFGNEANRSTHSLMGMAASVQDLFVPLGFTRKQASELSVQLTKLAVDVGSFNDMLSPDVMQAFASALVGNHETVRRFGVQIDQNTLKQQLLNMGIKDNIQDVDTATKVQARLNLILEGTVDAQGDAIETADSYTNSVQGLNGAMEELGAQLGNKMLPMLAKFNTGMISLIEKITESLTLHGFIATNDVQLQLKVINKEMVALEKQLKKTEDRRQELLHLVEVAPKANKGLTENLIFELDQVNERYRRQRKELDRVKHKFGEVFMQTEQYTNATKSNSESVGDNTERTKAQKKALTEVEAIEKRLDAEIREYTNAIKMNDDALFQANMTMLNLEKVTDQLSEKDIDYIEILRTKQTELNRVKEKYSESQKVIDELTAKQQNLNAVQDEFIGLVEGVANAYESSFIDALTGTKSALESFKDFSRSLVEEIIRTYIRLSVINPIINSIFGDGPKGSFQERAVQSPTQFLDKLTHTGRKIVGRKAMGGSVSTGQPYMVGERGPELFVPNQSGVIKSNGSVGTVINQSLNFSTGIQNTVRAEVMNMMPMIQNATLQAVVDQKRRGGAFAQGMT